MRKYSDRLMQTVANVDGTFKWDLERGNKGGRFIEARIGGAAIFGFAGVDTWDQPYLTYLEKTRTAPENRFRVTMTLIDAQHLFLNPTGTGFAVPTSDMEGVNLYVDDEWGNRRYTVYNTPDFEVTVSELQISDEESIEGYTYPEAVSSEDAETIRTIIDGSLSVWEDVFVET